MSSIHYRLRRFGAVLGCAVLLSGGLGIAAGSAGAETPPAPICPSSTANGRFVRYLYINILFRCPDVAGGAFWTAQLDAGMSRSALADILDMSNENVVNNNVVPLYQQFLVRPPTSAELTAGINSIRSNHSDANLIADIASSDEFFTTYSTKTDPTGSWLNFVYNGVLERDPEGGAIEFFIGQITPDSIAGGRRWVVMTLEHSPENATDWTTAALGAAFGRAPDGGGMTFWTGWLQGSGNWQTFRMWTLMLSSQEGFNVAQTQPNPPPEPSAPSAAAPLAMR